MCRCCPNFSKQQGSLQLLARFQKCSLKMAQAAFLLAIAAGAEPSHVLYCALRGEKTPTLFPPLRILNINTICNKWKLWRAPMPNTGIQGLWVRPLIIMRLVLKSCNQAPASKVASFLSAWILKGHNTKVHIFNVLVFLASDLKRSPSKK